MAEKKINGETYKVSPMLATEAIVLQARLMRVLGPAAVKLLGINAARVDGASDQDRAKADQEAIAAITGIFAGSEPREISGLIKDIVETAMVQRSAGRYEPIDMDMDFTGRLGDLIPVVTFALKEQFGDFFPEPWPVVAKV